MEDDLEIQDICLQECIQDLVSEEDQIIRDRTQDQGTGRKEEDETRSLGDQDQILRPKVEERGKLRGS